MEHSQLEDKINEILIIVSKLETKVTNYAEQQKKHDIMIEELYNKKNTITDRLTTIEIQSRSCEKNFASRDEVSQMKIKQNIITAVFSAVGFAFLSAFVGLIIKLIIR